ncbi:hypothetical protein KHA96_17410 [Bacillus sp. FJAT-49711]|uniref:hypothetical protein n=1 Tax=Bacillus sp. FJAT-49711 TaxID=2833585 RepID=UPI001BC9B44E|nr:hypothetical protein [Bacillus sp. FJAT-49711]MBS4220093.1 hypothetical protein [Bacillus sp. FJAT-49711]
MERVSEHQECPDCAGVMMVNYNPTIVVERDEQCFRCGYFHEVTIIREKNESPSIKDIPKEVEIGEANYLIIEGLEENGTPIKDENGNYLLEEVTYQGYGCYELARRDGSKEFSTFNKPITSDKIAEFQEELRDPFYDPNKSFVAEWDSEKKEQIVLIGDQKNIPDNSRLSFKEWFVRMKKS